MAYTRRQKLALARAPPAMRQRMAASFNTQNGNGNGNGRRRSGRNPPATRSMGEVVLAPGVGRSVPRPFGNTGSTWGLCVWDALHPSHLPLPRGVGPYTVVRTTTIFNSTAKVNVFGVSRLGDGHEGPSATGFNTPGGWTNVISWGSATAGDPINDANNVSCRTVPVPGALTGSSSTFTCVPAAFSLQIMNLNALQTTDGLVFAAVCPTQLNLQDNSRTWNSLREDFISYMRPRLMSAPKLALRGVQLNSYPLNMSALAEFSNVYEFTSGASTWTSAQGASTIPGNAFPTGMAPFVVINDNATSITYAVTVEWRVRFDISNPAVSSHVHHKVSTDAVWDGLLKKATALGNGVMDIADTVATVGNAVRKASSFMPA